MNTNVLSLQDGTHLVAGLVHAHTTVSDGAFSPDELVAEAHRRGLGVVCITDHHDDGWRHRFGLRLRRPSVVRFGTANYVQAIAAVSERSEGPIVLGGIEIAPHHRWEGLFPYLKCEAMKTFVAYGIGRVEIDALPVIVDGRGRDEPEALRTAQAVIDAVRSAGGSTYWSNLELDERAGFGPASMRVRPRPELLELVHGYTGFGCFPRGREACVPGGAWDMQLARSARHGTFGGPWVLGEADYHSDKACGPERSMTSPTTVFRLSRLDAGGVLEALGAGRMYAYAGSTFARSRLERFFAIAGASRAESGSVLRAADASELVVELAGWVDGCEIRVIAGGRIVHTTRSPEMRYPLAAPADGAYAVRVEIRNERESIMSNPIFVAPPGDL